MATLTSKILKDIRRLQRCANEPMQHVMLKTPRETGPHVTAIHKALAMLGFDDVEAPEIFNAEYGPSTAEQVWQFKKKFDIRSPGQVVPDRIVGQLTIQRMDSLLPGGKQNDDPSDDNVTVFEISPKKVLKAKVFWLTSAKDGDNVSNPIAGYLVGATKVLSPHGMQASADRMSPASLIPFDEDLDGLHDKKGTLSRARAAVGAPLDVGGVVVIVGKFKTPFKPGSKEGVTEVGHTEFKTPFFEFPTTIFLNSRAFSSDNVTLVHEMGHVAGADLHGLTEKDWQSDKLERNFMSHKGTGGRSEMMKWQGDALAAAPFAFESKK